MITLITGTPGSGKTLFAVTKILEYVKQNQKLLEQGKEPRMIYANIDGLNIDGVEPAPVDWRDTPDGSVIFYDEIQQLEPYKKSRYDNEICDALQIHRHTGHDIFGITQFPVLLHPNFRAVVGMHHHLHRGWGLSSATIFNWAYCVDSPNAPSNKKLAEHTERFNYDKSVYKYYKSATIHTHKKRIPKNLFFIILGVILFGYFAVKMLFFNDNFFSKIYGVEQKSTEKTQQDDATNSTFSLSTDSQNNSQSESITQNNYEHHQDELHNRRLFLYQRDLPEDYIIRRQDPMLQVRGVMKMGNNCIAYNSYGDRMTLSNKECLDYINTGKVYRSEGNGFNNTTFTTPTETSDQQQIPPKEPQQTTQGITSTEEYLFADKSKTEPIFNPS